MNLIEFAKIISDPTEISKKQTRDLDRVLDDYPFFQAAHFLRLYGLKKYRSFRYNDSLKETAAHSTDRSLLFDYITTFDFELPGDAKPDFQKTTEVTNEVKDADELERTLEKAPMTDESRTLETPVTERAKDTAEDQSRDTGKDQAFDQTKELDIEDQARDQDIEDEKELLDDSTGQEELQLGRPINFKSDDTFSFAQWLQLSDIRPIERKDPPGTEKDKTGPRKKSKFDLITEFIAKSPKIEPGLYEGTDDLAAESSRVDDQLMTETLAHVYLEQKKYDKAIAAFTVLSLKYPEKSSFFADRIEAVKKLQNN